MEWTDKDNNIHKCRIERARVFKSLKPFNITGAFVCHTVKLFLDTGGVSDRKKTRPASRGWYTTLY